MKKLIVALISIVLWCSVDGMGSTEHMKNKSVYCVILAGGSGERLWPLSKQKKPKQLLAVGEQNFLCQAIERVRPIAQSQDTIWVVTSAHHEEAIRQSVEGFVGTILVEPDARNTGPAVLYSCLAIEKIDPDALVVFLPADPFIDQQDYENFAQCVQRALDHAHNHDVISLLGVRPTMPATGYGYIEFDSASSDVVTGLHKVRMFHEKPSLVRAQEYIQKNTMLWNIGMFCGKVSVFKDHFQHLAPSLYADFIAIGAGKKQYADIQSISVDCAIIEPSTQVWVLPVDFSWCDVGDVNVFLTLKKQFSQNNGRLIEIDAHNNLVDVPHKLVSFVGVSDLCVIETEHELLIVNRAQAQKVKNIVQQLKNKQEIQYL
jgi:mannose-1-phosphate guanylyltransferase